MCQQFKSKIFANGEKQRRGDSKNASEKIRKAVCVFEMVQYVKFTVSLE